MEADHRNVSTSLSTFHFRKPDPLSLAKFKQKYSIGVGAGVVDVSDTDEEENEPTPTTPRIMRLLKSSSTNLVCAVCFGMNGRVCQGCFSVAYCCREHQVQHWILHQSSCRPLVSVQKEEVLRNLSAPVEDRSTDVYLGMYKAAKELKSNDVVLQLQPIMYVAHNKGVPVPPDSILCLGCNKWYQHSQGYRCSSCKWPVCSEKCELDSCHSMYECRIFADNKVHPPLNPSYYNGDIVLALRCLILKQTNPKDWRQLMELEPVVKRAVRPKHCFDSDEKVAKYLIYNCRVQESFNTTYQELMNLLKIIDFCSVWLPERSTFLWDKQSSYVSTKYVFPAKVLIAEECNPNCSWSLSHSSNLKECSIRLRASSNISPGQYLTACFRGISEYGASFPKRYENCRFLYQCKCRRCKDPTEGGSFFSGVKCPICEDMEMGYLLPEDAFNYNGVWRCYNKLCGNVVGSGADISHEIVLIYKEIVYHSNSLQGLLNVIKNYERVKLHPNHYLLMKATQLSLDLCWGVCQNTSLHVIGVSLLDKAKALTEKLAKIYRVIYPWNSLQNAKLLFYYQMLHGISKVRELLWIFEHGQIPMDEEDSQFWPNEFWEIVGIQKLAVEVLMKEPLGSIERECGSVMNGVLEDTESLLVVERRDSKINYETLIGLQKVYSRYCSDYLHPALPVFEDKELNEFILFTGPYCKI